MSALLRSANAAFNLRILALCILQLCACTSRQTITEPLTPISNSESAALTAPILFPYPQIFVTQKSTSKFRTPANVKDMADYDLGARLEVLNQEVSELLAVLDPTGNPAYYLAFHFNDEVSKALVRLREVAAATPAAQKDLQVKAWSPLQDLVTSGVNKSKARSAGANTGGLGIELGDTDKEILYLVRLATLTMDLVQEAKRLKIYRELSADAKRRVQSIREIVQEFDSSFLSNHESIQNFQTQVSIANQRARIRMVERCLRVLYNQGVSYYAKLMEIQRNPPSQIMQVTSDLRTELANDLRLAWSAYQNNLAGEYRPSGQFDPMRLQSRFHSSAWKSHKYFENPDLIESGEIEGVDNSLQQVNLVQYSYLAINYIMQ